MKKTSKKKVVKGYTLAFNKVLGTKNDIVGWQLGEMRINTTITGARKQNSVKAFNRYLKVIPVTITYEI